MIYLIQLPWYKDPMVISSLVVAVSTVAYVFVSILLWRVTKKSAQTTQSIFEAANRPYIGIFRLTTECMDGMFRIQVDSKNFGSVPARNVRCDIEYVLNGTVLPNPDYSKEIIAFAPQQPHCIQGTLGHPVGSQVCNGTGTLEV